MHFSRCVVHVGLFYNSRMDLHWVSDWGADSVRV